MALWVALSEVGAKARLWFMLHTDHDEAWTRPKSCPSHKAAGQWQVRSTSLVSDRSERQLQITKELLPRRDTINCQAGITYTSPALLPSPRPGYFSTAQCPSPSSCILSLYWKACVSARWPPCLQSIVHTASEWRFSNALRTFRWRWWRGENLSSPSQPMSAAHNHKT